MKFMASCLAMAACLAGASAASAGTSTGTGTATFKVVTKCEISGTTVNLGTFRTTDTLQAVASKIGYQDGNTFELIAGTDGIGTVSMGSVTCDDGTPYTITMDSTGWSGSLDLGLPGGKTALFPMVKKIGNYVVPDGEPYFNGFGKWPSSENLPSYTDQSPVGTTGNGTAQPILGNVIIFAVPVNDGVYMGVNDQLGTAGVYSASWVSTLHF